MKIAKEVLQMVKLLEALKATPNLWLERRASVLQIYSFLSAHQLTLVEHQMILPMLIPNTARIQKSLKKICEHQSLLDLLFHIFSHHWPLRFRQYNCVTQKIPKKPYLMTHLFLFWTLLPSHRKHENRCFLTQPMGFGFELHQLIVSFCQTLQLMRHIQPVIPAPN